LARLICLICGFANWRQQQQQQLDNNWTIEALQASFFLLHLFPLAVANAIDIVPRWGHKYLLNDFWMYTLSLDFEYLSLTH
jgi:hypothetical protein